jgi:hypothetical protein
VNKRFGQDGLLVSFPSTSQKSALQIHTIAAGVVITTPPDPTQRHPQHNIPGLGPILLQALAFQSHAISVGFLDGSLTLLKGQVEGSPGW